MVKNLPATSGGTSLIPGQGTKIPQVARGGQKKSQKVPRLHISWKKCTLLSKYSCESIFKVYTLCVIWHKNCITSLARLPWYIAHEKMFSVALLAYGNHEPYFWFFSPFVCAYTCILKSFHITFLFSSPKGIYCMEKINANIPFLCFFSFKILTQKISCSYWLFTGVKHNRIVHGRYKFKIQWLHSLHISCLSLKSYFGFCMK